ncbi:hypothetical protein [Ferruginibacter sp. SUN106]|uniref:hypothetical protein n=1 Tax=Ferruginibacter sp. SUN106 TaxID=2978348 RepID=UPI003D369571
MKKKIIMAATMTSMLIYMLSSCYKNKEDILTLPTVSFRGEVVPIIASGGCGCHINGKVSNAVAFAHGDTVFYDAILSRSAIFGAWVNGGSHPGGGIIDFKPNEKVLIKQWIAEGAKDDGGGCTVTGALSYATNIAPIYNTTCKGSTCHGGIAVALDYNKLLSDKDKLTTMMSSSGNGHPGGPLSLSSCTVKIFTEWINQGLPK